LLLANVRQQQGQCKLFDDGRTYQAEEFKPSHRRIGWVKLVYALCLYCVSQLLRFIKDTITRLLYSLGTKREVERHLRIFSSSSHPSQPAKFAVIKIGGAVLDQLDELAHSLSFLYRVGLYPVVLHGGGPQLNEIIEREGIVPDYIDGIRVTGMF